MRRPTDLRTALFAMVFAATSGCELLVGLDGATPRDLDAASVEPGDDALADGPAGDTLGTSDGPNDAPSDGPVGDADRGPVVSLTYEQIGGADGIVVADAGDFECLGSGRCELRPGKAGPIELRARPKTAIFRGWSGACGGLDRICRIDVPASGTIAVGARFEATPSPQIFVTSQTFGADFGKIENADAHCAKAAADAGIDGTFRALISFGTTSGLARFVGERNYVRVDGAPFVEALTASAFFRTLHWPELDEYGRVIPFTLVEDAPGVTVSAAGVATGIDRNGNVRSWCGGWTSTTGRLQIGLPRAGARSWLEAEFITGATGRCASVRLYCAQIGKGSSGTLVVPAAPAGARTVFLAKPAALTTDAGLDARCNDEGKAFGKPFAAFVSTERLSAIDRVGGVRSDDVFARPDGVVVARGAELANEWRSGIWQWADGTYASAKAWAGGNPAELATRNCSGSCACNDWTPTSGSGLYRMPEVGRRVHAPFACSAPDHSVVCVEKR
jgi:hypothetical protein